MMRVVSDAELRSEMLSHPEYSRYVEWKNKYPNVFQEFRNKSLQLVEKKKRFGMWLIANLIRWNYYFEYDTDFKISDHLTAFIARDLMLEIPELKTLCRIRPMKLRKTKEITDVSSAS